MSTGFQIAGCIGSSLFAGVYSIGMEAGENGFSHSAILAGILAVIGFIIAIYLGRTTGKERS